MLRTPNLGHILELRTADLSLGLVLRTPSLVLRASDIGLGFVVRALNHCRTWYYGNQSNWVWYSSSDMRNYLRG